MLQSTSEYEERNFDDIQRALDIEHTVKALESQLCYDQHSPEEVARQILKAACKFYDADWCGLINNRIVFLSFDNGCHNEPSFLVSQVK